MKRGAETQDRASQGSQRDKDRRPQSGAWATGQGAAGGLRHRSRQASEHSPPLSPLLPHFPVGRWALMDTPVCVTCPQPPVEGQHIKTPTNTN